MNLYNLIAPLIRLADLDLTNEHERMRILTRTALCSGAVTHIVLFMDFYLMDVPEMMYFNVISVVWWLGALVWHLRSRQWFGPMLSIWPEVMLHAVLATWFVGWGTGYWIYCVIMIAGMGVSSRGTWLGEATFAVTLVLFGGWYLLGPAVGPKYSIDPGLARLHFVVNAAAAFGFMLLTIKLPVVLLRQAQHIVDRLRGHAEEQRATVETALQELKSTQAQLIQQEKLASLGQLTAGIAHEIKNPLNFITNFAELSIELADDLRGALARDEPVEDVLEDLVQNARRISRHGERANNIVKSMMQHASSGRGERIHTDLNGLVDHYIDLAYHGKRVQIEDFAIDITRSMSEDVGSADIVPQDIGRVILNLLSNAFDAVHEKKQTGLETYRPVVRVSTHRSTRLVEIRISDNGPGIPTELRERIFDPFFSTKPAGSGTGLGLSLSYDIVTQGYGGALSVASDQEEGVTFIVSLPANQPPQRFLSEEYADAFPIVPTDSKRVSEYEQFVCRGRTHPSDLIS